MPTTDQPAKQQYGNLPSKPLAEAIFELRWKLDDKKMPGANIDPGFRLLLGRFYDRIKGSYPTMVDLPTTQVPEELTGHSVRHQFRTGPDAWPLVQLGPGIMTFNEATAYHWESFKTNLLSAVAATFESYPTEITAFEPVETVLRYLNVMPQTDKVLGFLREKLHTTVAVEPELFKDGAAEPESPIGVNLNAIYRLNKPMGAISLLFGTGIANKKPSLVWELNVRSKVKDSPKNLREFENWITEAHEVIEHWFFTLSRGELLENFRKAPNAENKNSRV